MASYLAATRAQVDSVLADWGGRVAPGPIAAAMQYSLLGAGKRLRPTLVFASYEAVGGTGQAIAELAAAIERFLGSAELRRRLAGAARGSVAHLSAPLVYGRIEGLLADVVAR